LAKANGKVSCSHLPLKPLRFPKGFVHIREVVKYTDYKLLPKK
jgi:hypothetical protein